MGRGVHLYLVGGVGLCVSLSRRILFPSFAEK